MEHAFRAPAARWPVNFDLIVVTAGALLALSTVALDFPVSVRLPIGLVATVILPGYALSMALFPRGEVSGVERSALAFGLSLGVIVLSVPALNVTPFGLHAGPAVVTVVAITLVATAVGWWRRRARPSGHVWPGITPLHLGPRLGARRYWALAGLGFILLVLVIAFGLTGPPRVATEFFVLGPDGTIESLPTRMTTGAPTTVTLTIRSHEDSSGPYRIVVETGESPLASVGPISVQPGETWSGRISFSVARPGNNEEVRILLFKDPATHPFRSLRLEVDAISPSP